MKNTVLFRIHDELNDFIDRNKKNQDFEYSYEDNTSIKDNIEAVGIPHTEVELITVNGISVDFSFKTKNNDKIEVYPVLTKVNIEPKIVLRPAIKEYKFIVDANVAKVAKYLRMMGFDTHYDFDLPDKEIVNLAEREERIILSRDIGLLKRKNAIYGYFLRKTNIEQQVIEVIARYNFINHIKPLSICLECNGKINMVEKSEITEKLNFDLPNDFETFYQCNTCRKVFWKGSHYDTMMANIQKLINQSNNH